MTPPKIRLYSKKALLLAGLCLFVFVWRCPIYHIIGLPCPGCGMSRACLAFLQGNLSKSLQMHAMLIPTGLCAILYCLNKKARKPVLYLWIAAMLLYYTWRIVFLWGEQPMVFNEQSVLFWLIRLFKKIRIV
jgi:hypothetical protein